MPKIFTSETQKTGEIGENIAVKFLVKQGFLIKERNYTKKWGEIDIIAKAPDKTLIFVEVKTRLNKIYGEPSDAVDFKKIRSLQIFAREYIKRKKINCDYRIDIISVVASQVEHFQNVTWP